MNRFLPAIYAVLCAFLLCGASFSSDFTVNTGDTLIATLGLSEYRSVCSSPLGPCPTFPASVEPFVMTNATALPLDHFSMQAYVQSTSDGKQFLLGTLSFELTTWVEKPGYTTGIFRYNGGVGWPAFPADPTFWGPDPASDTFELLLQNTGDPFSLLIDPAVRFYVPTDAVGADLGTKMEGGMGIAARTLGLTAGPVGVADIPEPGGLSAIGGLVLGVLAVCRRRRAA